MVVVVVFLEGFQVLDAARRAVHGRRVTARVGGGALGQGAPKRIHAPAVLRVERVILLHFPRRDVPVDGRLPAAHALRGPALGQLGPHALLR